MTARRLQDGRLSGSFGDIIANVSVRGFFHELVDVLTHLHEDVEVQYSPVDIRAEYCGRTICRIVPYRELVHMQIGDDPVWEVRIRGEAGYLDAVDLIFDVFLKLVATAGRERVVYRHRTILPR